MQTSETLLSFIQRCDEAFRSPTRLASLFSDFTTQRNSNPDGYAANSQAWLRALTIASGNKRLPGQTDVFVFQAGDQLARAFQSPQYGRPLALQAVIEDAIKQSKLVPVTDFLNGRGSKYEKGWIPNPWHFVGWALTRLGSPIKSRGAESYQGPSLVMVDRLKETAETLIWTHDGQTSSSSVSLIYSSDLFMATFKGITGHFSAASDSFKVLIRHLSEDVKRISYDPVNQVIKFNPINGSRTPVTSQDVDIAKLRDLMYTLDHQVAKIEQEVASLSAKVREAVKANNMPAARRQLKMKKAAETTLEQRNDTLYQLQGVYFKIEQAADQVEAVKVMQAAGRTLQALNKQAGDVDDIREMMDQLQESIADTDDIGNAITDHPSAVINEAEVEAELEALEREAHPTSPNGPTTEHVRQETEAEQTRLKLEALTVPSDIKDSTSASSDQIEAAAAHS